MKTKCSLYVMAFLSLTLPPGRDQARAQCPAQEAEKVTAPAQEAEKATAPALEAARVTAPVHSVPVHSVPVHQAAKVIVPYKNNADLNASPEELAVATRIDQLRNQLSSADPQQRKVNESKLRDAVEEQFDLRQARLGRELEALRGEVSELETLVSGSPARRAKAIARGLRSAVLEEELPGEEMHLRAGTAQAGTDQRLMGTAQAGLGTDHRLMVAAPYEHDVVLRIVQLSWQLGRAAEGERADIEKQLREALGEQFDRRQARFARALAALREEVQELDELVKKRRERRDQAIARRLRSLGVGRD